MRATAEHHEMVYRIAHRVLGNASDAEDVTQGVYLRLLQFHSRLRRESSLKAWLAKTTLNAARLVLRRDATRRERERRWGDRKLEQRKTQPMLSAEEVNGAIDALSEELRIPVILHYQEGMTHREIAEALACPEGTVARRLSSARDRLRKRLEHLRPLAAAAGLEASLSQRPTIAYPEGLKATLRNAVNEGWAARGGLEMVTSMIPWKTMGVAGLAALLVLTAGLWWLIPSGSDGGAPHGLAGREAERPSQEAPERDAGERPGEPVLPRAEPAESDAKAEPEGVLPPGAIADEAAIYGWVRSNDGTPLPGVTIRAISQPRGRRLEQAETDEEGYFAISELPEPERLEEALRIVENVRESFEVPDAILDELARFVASELRAGGSIRLRLPGGTEIFRGTSRGGGTGEGWRVVDPPEELAGVMRDAKPKPRPAPSPRIEWGRPSGTRTSGGSDSQLRVVAIAPGYRLAVSRLLDIDAPEPARVDFLLERTEPLDGVVVDDRGLGVPEATVIVAASVSSRDDMIETAGKTRSGSDGTFRFASLPEGDYILQARAAGYTEAEQLAGNGRPARIVLERAGAVRATVVHAEEKLPIFHAQVMLRGPGGFEETQRTGDRGEASFEPLVPGDYTVSVMRDVFPLFERSIAVAEGEAASIRAVLGEGITLTGRLNGAEAVRLPGRRDVAATLLSDDRSVPPLSVRRALQRDGGFRIQGLVPGRYLLTVYHRIPRQRRHYEIAAEQEIALAGDRHVEFHATSPARAHVELLILDETGHPMGKTVTVQAIRMPAALTNEYEIEDGGRIAFDIPPGRYDLSLSAWSGYDVKILRDIALAPGEAKSITASLDPHVERAQGLRLLNERLLGRRVRLHAPVRLRSLLEILDALAPRVLLVAPELRASGVLDRCEVRDGGGGALGALESAIYGAGLKSEARSGQLWLLSEDAH
ncbi:MAG: sigma-70 family RNA polymerase sigma factor [Planctomycetes bacterium]|nr:sigma-70 family RNA polymerase sigma factor [Planctomycetota bacterium]